MNVIRTLTEKIRENNFSLAIIGLGYVGLPLAHSFVIRDTRVVGFDIDKNKIEMLGQGKSYISHIPDKTIANMLSSRNFEATSDFSELTSADVILICVPTPLNKFREPDLSAVLTTVETVKKYLRHGQLVVLESSTYPGTTDEEIAPILESTGLKKNVDFFLAYSPEREDPGNTEFTNTEIPKIIGADSEETLQLVAEFYKRAINRVVLLRSTKSAEAAKLTENIFRSVNIALVNELKIVFDRMGIDVWDVIDAAATKPFGFMPFYPGPGLGGHCIPVDPFYLSSKAREFGVSTRFIELAGEINTFMPNFVVDKVVEGLSEVSQKSVKNSRLLILGISYKKDIDDTRESPSFVIIKQLMARGAVVDFYDPFCPKIPALRDHPDLLGRESIELSAETIRRYDAVVICTDHTDVDYQLIGDNSNLVIDTRNVMDSHHVKARLIKA